MEVNCSLETFKRPISDWFLPKHKCKVSSYVFNTGVLLRSRPNGGFSLNYFSFLLQILCIEQNYSFSHSMFQKNFYLRMSKPTIHNNIIGISSFQNGINNFFSSTSFYFKSKLGEGKGKNMFFKFWALFQNASGHQNY